MTVVFGAVGGCGGVVYMSKGLVEDGLSWSVWWLRLRVRLTSGGGCMSEGIFELSLGVACECCLVEQEMVS